MANAYKKEHNPTSLWMACPAEEEQQHKTNDKRRADSNDCQRRHRSTLIGVFLFPCSQTETKHIGDYLFKQECAIPKYWWLCFGLSMEKNCENGCNVQYRGEAYGVQRLTVIK